MYRGLGGHSKSDISRVIIGVSRVIIGVSRVMIGVAPFRVINLLVTYLANPWASKHDAGDVLFATHGLHFLQVCFA